MAHPFARFRSATGLMVLVGYLLVGTTTSSATNYKITIDGENPRVAIVEASLFPDQGSIFMNDGGDQGLTHGWSTFVHGLEVVDAAGKPIESTYEPLSRWRLDADPSGPITIRYRVLLQHDRFPLNFGDNGAAYARDDAVMWAGRALFIAGQKDRDIEVVFELPEGWKATTPWAQLDERPGAYVVVNSEDLLNSAFMAGNHVEQVVQQGDLELRLALAGANVTTAKDLFADEMAKYLDYYESTIGPAPKRQMLVIAADSSYWGGEVMGRAISLSVAGEVSEPNPMLGHLFAHEIAHLWGLDMNFSEEGEEELYWFYEGMLAEYLSTLATVRLGDIPEETFLAQLADNYSKYKAAWQPGLSMSKAGHEKAAHYDLVYSGGMMTAAALDLTIRAESDNQKGLEDLIRTLYTDYPKSGGSRSESGTPRLESGDIASITTDLYGDRAGDALATWIDGTEEIPYSELVSAAGLMLSEEISEDGPQTVLHPIEDPSTDQKEIYKALVASDSQL